LDVVVNGAVVGRGKFNENLNTAIDWVPRPTRVGANTAIGRGALAQM
jgi:hypothetical protein